MNIMIWRLIDVKKYRFENRDKIKRNRCDYREKTNEYVKNKKKLDLKFKSACILRSRTSLAFKSQIVRKPNKLCDLIGCSLSFFESWISNQIYGKMTLDNFGSIRQIDHCLPIASFNLLDENDMKKCFIWINLRPMFSSENNLK